MGRRGPLPTPSLVLGLRGSWRANGRQATPRVKPELPTTPPWLKGEAKKAFRLLARRLHALGLVCRLDEVALARYANLWVLYRRAEQFVAEKGETYVVRAKPGPNGEPGRPLAIKTYPQVRHMEMMGQVLVRLEKEFGLTPASRERLAADVPVAAPMDPAYDYFSPPQ